ncbi:MAG TPA: neutral/alkaline non-lysosomal ceramidase N-terminal domain-containing protein [Planctomycetota bacterium]|nr:neutral/alkaline non-lysosomal ceramidase N-terminal domain-containing protein [Planctomycetota bacterium]
MTGKLILAIAIFAAPAEGDWKVGLASVKITPEEPVQMSGYASRIKPFEKVNDDLYAKAIALEDAQGHRAVLITSDLIGFKGEIADPICERIGAKTGLKREEILLNSIHTHSAPSLSLDENPRDATPAEDARRTAAYTRGLQDKVVELAVRALGKMEPARLSWGTGVAGFVMNRREPTPRGIILGFNPRGHVDRSVPVLRVDGLDGSLRAVVFGCACHNTTLTQENMLISGDYGGYAQRQIEELHPGALALMMLGCAGDANPHPRGTLQNARDHGVSLGREVDRVLGTKLRPVRGPLRTVLERVDLPLQAPPSREELEKLAKSGPGEKRGVYKSILGLLDRGEKAPSTYRAPLGLWQFGEDLTMVVLSGEVVVDYVSLLEKSLGPLNLWVAAYSNDVYGYLPSARILEEGGYETRGTYYGGPGLFAPAAQDALVGAIRGMAEKAGRPGLK